MPSRAVEEAHLLQARRQVASAQARIANQFTAIARLRARGLDTRRAETSLGIMRETLKVMYAYEGLVEQMLAQHDADTIVRATLHTSSARSER